MFSAKKREAAELALIKHHLADGGVFVDIGSNIGYYALNVALMSAGKVIAIEPNPPVLARLRDNIALNDLQSKITVHDVAIGATKGIAHLTISDNDFGSSSIVNQREVGVDTRSWHNALKNTLRQAPDVILIGEIRDRETMEHAISFAETGHLCISTLHANNANQALDRIINFFPDQKRRQLLLDLSLNLQAFVSQRLIPNQQGARSAAIEILLGTPTVNELITRGDIGSIKEVMEKSEELGMKTFDKALFDLYEAGKITAEEALKNADSVNNLRLRIKMADENGTMTSTGGFTMEGLEEDEPTVFEPRSSD